MRLSSTAAGDGSPEAPHTAAAAETRCQIFVKAETFKAVLWIRIRMLLDLTDPPLFCTDPDPSIIKQKKSKKNLDFCSVTFFYFYQ